MLKKFDLTEDEKGLVLDGLVALLQVEEATLKVHIESDQTPETIEEFLRVIVTQQERVYIVDALLRRFLKE